MIHTTCVRALSTVSPSSVSAAADSLSAEHAAVHQGGSTAALGPCQATRESSQTSLQGAAHAPVEHQPAGSLGGPVPQAGHRRTGGAQVVLWSPRWRLTWTLSTWSGTASGRVFGGFSLDRVAAAVRLCHHSPHGSRVRHQPRNRARIRAWHHTQRLGPR